MKVGDLVMNKNGKNGMIMTLGDQGLDDDGTWCWVEILWSNGKFTWEDMDCSIECGSIWLVSS